MRSRREQVQAYRFVTRRIVSALLSGDPETNDLPMRRLGLALFGSMMVGAIVFGAVGVYGQLTKRQAPLEAETLVIERETGAKYVYLEDRLYPTLNYASARLVLNKPNPEIRTMSQASLKGYPRGLPVGIPDAPDALPEPSALLGHPWRICTTVGNEFQKPSTYVVVGRDLPGGVELNDQALLVTARDVRYLLWNDTRLRIPGSANLTALGLSDASALPVGDQLINAVKAGPDLRLISVPGAGEPSTRDLGMEPGESVQIGDVFRVSGQHYVLTREGLVPVGEVTAQLRVAIGRKLRDINPQIAARNMSDRPLEPEGFPQRMPALHQGATKESTICAVYRNGEETTSIEVHQGIPEALTATTSGVEARQSKRDSVRTVDHVVIEGGRGALVQASSPDGSLLPGATVYLLTDRGVKYPLDTASGDARAALGYGETTPVAVPKSLLDLVPTGPTLGTAAARQFVDLSDGDRNG
jgi:type VII secretion protein EccB